MFWLKKVLLFFILFFLIDFGISKLLVVGLNKYFGLNTKTEILINGSSMSLAGFNKSDIEAVTHKNVSFYSRNGVSLEDRNAMLNHYFNSSKQKTKIAILEVNPLIFSKKFTAANVHLLFLPFMDDPSMDEFIKSKTSFEDYWVRKLIRTSRFNTDLISLAFRGYLGSYENKKDQFLDENALEGLKGEVNTVSVELNQEKFTLFQNTLDLVQQKAEYTILVNMPIFSAKKETFKDVEYNGYVDAISNFVKTKENIYFLDLNQSKLINNPTYFSDPLHLNSKGQKEVTRILTNFLKEVELNESRR